MNTTDLLNIRLHNQLLATNTMKTPGEVVAWMGAMQSQNYEMAKWGIGVRLPCATSSVVEDAVNRGEIIRTHILRPTWHFIVSEDIYWMLDLCVARLKPVFLSYGKLGGIDEDTTLRGLNLIPAILERNGHLTSQETREELKKMGMVIAPDRVKYIMSRAELEGIVCSGAVRSGKQTYALLHTQAPRKIVLSKEEALERLARKFFSSHGPATLQDYIWWSGLVAAEARKGIELIKGDFICEEINGKSYWMKGDIQTPSASESALLLPAFDEFVVSYKDRTEILEEEHYRKIITRTGVFSPTINLNGQIIGSWKKVIRRKKPEVEFTFFNEKDESKKALFENQAKAYEYFLTSEKQ